MNACYHKSFPEAKVQKLLSEQNLQLINMLFLENLPFN